MAESRSVLNWDICALCQNLTQESLICPFRSKRPNVGIGYRTLAENILKFNKLGALPIKINISLLDEGHGILDTFQKREASWHKSCKEKFSNTKYERVVAKNAKKHEQIIPTQKFTRSSTASGSEDTVKQCFFCNKALLNHQKSWREVNTLDLSRKIKRFATDLNDFSLLRKCSSGDLISMKAKYHHKCLVQFYNRHRSATTKKEEKRSQLKSIHGIIFAELVAHIEEIRRNVPRPSFKLSELAKLYNARLLVCKITVTIHSSRLKKRIMNYYPDLLSHTIGRDVLLTFQQDIAHLISETINSQFEIDADAIQIAKAAAIVRNEILSAKVDPFNGKFEMDCQEKAVPKSLKALISMILAGPTIVNQTELPNTIIQPTLTIGQLIVFNTRRKKIMTSKASKDSADKPARHNRDRETPLVIYIGLYMGQTRRQSFVDMLFSLGLSISYDRVLQIGTLLANKVISRFEAEQVVCPPNLKRSLFTVGMIDNFDHNTSSTTAKGSIHGTMISIMQLPETENPGFDREEYTEDPVQSTNCELMSLPESYTNVCPIILKTKEPIVPLVGDVSDVQSLEQDIHSEFLWLNHASDYVLRKVLDHGKSVTWASYHSSLLVNPSQPIAINSILPLFYESAHTPSMIRHGMDLVKSVIAHVNPGQTPIIAVDQPLYALAKQIQWSWPDTHGENSFVIMFGGLHIEMAMFRTIGDWLKGSGWDRALVQAGITTIGTAESFLKASHLTRTRNVHQVTALSLYILQRDAYQIYTETLDDVLDLMDFKQWCDYRSEFSPQFKYWATTLKFQLQILVFIRSLREGNFKLYIQSLEEIIPWFFALDHTNYSRWLPVHVRDMVNLKFQNPPVAKEFERGKFVVHKTNRRFSGMAYDQAHEQNNALVKGLGGVVGLTENYSALIKFFSSAPELVRCIDEFEKACNHPEELVPKNSDHHEQTNSQQQKFADEVSSLVQTMKELGNPFAEESHDLIVLDTKTLMDDTVINTVKNIEHIGRNQYENFKKKHLKSSADPLTNTISKNKLSLFSKQTQRVKSKESVLLHQLKNDCSLFSRLYISCQGRDCDLTDFFVHENMAYPPSLADNGHLRHGQKSNLLECISNQGDIRTDFTEEPISQATIIDGAALVHKLVPKLLTTFSDYATKVFVPYVLRLLTTCCRVDVVWDVYIEESLKRSARDKRGGGLRKRVTPTTKLPTNWAEFLRVDENKTELFHYLTDTIMAIAKHSLDTSKELHATGDQFALSSPGRNIALISPCTHEEADTRVLLHAFDAAKRGCKTIKILTVDTDVVVLAIGHFEAIGAEELWIEFGSGKTHRFIAIHEIVRSLGPRLSLALPTFHAITGCDTVSFFNGRGKKTAWETLKTSSFDLIGALLEISFRPESISPDCLAIIEKFVVLMYDKTSECLVVDDARKELFCRKSRTLANIPSHQVGAR